MYSVQTPLQGALLNILMENKSDTFLFFLKHELFPECPSYAILLFRVGQ